MVLVRFVFRADASLEMGSGHAMRCFAIAEEAVGRKIECVLVGNLGGLKWLEERYADINCPVISPEDFLSSKQDDVLIVDSYSLQSDDSFITRHDWASHVDIVDEKTPLRESNLMIHPGLDNHWFDGDNDKFLFGSRFIPIRKSILQKNDSYNSDRLDKIVVFGGGTDLYGFAKVMSQNLCGLPGYTGSVFFSTEKEYIEGLDSRFKVMPFGGFLDNELRDAGLVFTTASTSSLEVIARGLPLGVACSVDNQSAIYHELSNSEVAVKIGERDEFGNWVMRLPSIKRLILDMAFRDDLRLSAEKYIDFGGAKRIVDAISAL